VTTRGKGYWTGLDWTHLLPISSTRPVNMMMEFSSRGVEEATGRTQRLGFKCGGLQS